VVQQVILQVLLRHKDFQVVQDKQHQIHYLVVVEAVLVVLDQIQLHPLVVQAVLV
jgi:hypothetical protein